MEVANMAAIASRKRGRKRRPDVLQKPGGVIHPRVQKDKTGKTEAVEGASHEWHFPNA
jgi:hypothetical protein